MVRVLKVVGIGVGAFVGLMLLFFVLEMLFGHDTTSEIGEFGGNLVTIFLGVAVVAIIVKFFRKKKGDQP